MATFLSNPKTDDIRPITDGIKQYRNFGYKFKMSTIGPRNGYWDVNGGILRWLDKEIVLKKLLVTVHKVCHHIGRHQNHTPSRDPRSLNQNGIKFCGQIITF